MLLTFPAEIMAFQRGTTHPCSSRNNETACHQILSMIGPAGIRIRVIYQSFGPTSLMVHSFAVPSTIQVPPWKDLI